ncbi:5,10-methylenetetrahydrofolate reductase [Paractinoplanes atraurantiacus]|uniref:5,10-methylenetetrahydrofolate reductase n=1 Tax=Paractinoplanes atraurantiacus TaxID=1036182 RepID=A0A285HH77_9ACTN|nr:5,10-methylenetetrahydrofolate reductase [Actinoplanes atraurantiacus]SNY35037.1 5,10-methylenetetrahydrofolate reductase [Actinoplanes atraurantiacus]
MSLQSKLEQATGGVMLFGVTPPRRSATPEKVKEIAEVTVKRLAGLDLDGLILYDIDDESDRNPDERPFPYLPTMDPAVFYSDHLAAWDKPVVIYRCVGKYTPSALGEWLSEADSNVLSVFVGASSGDKEVRTTLRQAQELRAAVRPNLPLGSVVIGERHARNGDEHHRMIAKQRRGSTFFVTQVIYDLNETKNLLTDYYYECQALGLTPRPVVFTLSLCGSEKTLEFLKWLGVDVPRWLSTTLSHSSDPLADSYRETLAIARDLHGFCTRLGLPFGFHVESVSIRRAEIEAATDLATEVAALLRG